MTSPPPGTPPPGTPPPETPPWGPPPGWYSDPWRQATWRWWDGASWTAHTSGYAGPAGGYAGPVGGIPPAELSAARASEEQRWRWARAALWAYAVIVLAQEAAFVVAIHRISPQWRHYWHELQQARNTGTTVKPPPFFNGFGSWVGLFDAGWLLVLLAGVGFLIWQYDATKVARGLGYPARHSPGLGIGSWFIPIVNLWFPYQSLRDCLPPQHPLRPKAAQAWIAYLAAAFIGSAGALAAIASLTAAVVLLALAAAGWLVVLKTGSELLRAVNDDHRQAAALP